jgi:flagellar biosynthesis component FlhA
MIGGMETNKPMKNLNSVFITVAMAAALTLVIFMPAALMDMLMAVNFILSLFLFLSAILRSQIRTKGNTEKNLPVFPIAVLLCAVFGLAAYVALTRLILISETEVDSKIILFISGLVSAGGTIGIIAGFGAPVVFCVVMALVTRGAARTAETAGRFIPDAMPIMAIERAYTSGEIIEEAFIARKGDIGKLDDFWDAMRETGKFIAGNAKVMIFIMAVGISGNIIIGTNLRGQTIHDLAQMSIAFGIGGAIFFLLPSLLLSVALGIVILSHGDKNEKPDSDKQIFKPGVTA